MTQATKNRDTLIQFAVRRTESMIRHYLRVGRIRECDADDLRQEALVTVIEKLDEYNKKHLTCEKTYINAIIKNVFKFHFLEARWTKNQPHQDVDELTEEEEPCFNEDNAGLSETDRINLRLDLLAFREMLNERQREVFNLLTDLTQSEIGLFLGISQTKVSRICDEIRSAAEKTALFGYF